MLHYLFNFSYKSRLSTHSFLLFVCLFKYLKWTNLNAHQFSYAYKSRLSSYMPGLSLFFQIFCSLCYFFQMFVEFEKVFKLFNCLLAGDEFLTFPNPANYISSPWQRKLLNSCGVCARYQ